MIKFPRVHIATSVQNRILDLADQVPATSPGIPSVPGPVAGGQRLDRALNTPLPAVAPPSPEAAQAGAASGGTAADALASSAVAQAFE